ncbi:MAG: branched-chain amino acid aminotransferase [Chitinispirillales bacterium]|jgi:branched-chain amino acid aminotransferase|nr:branched-chain amino acid aminotransferase [Chitinispirillales bacterium]
MAKKDIAWSDLGFSYMQTNSIVRMKFKNGKWGEIELLKDPIVPIHAAATSLHYGQAAFEGLKVFEMKNGVVAAFRPDENAVRMQDTAKRLLMEKVSTELFLQALNIIVKDNIDYVPPYGTGASMYVRPVLIGSGARIGVQPSDEYDFYILVMPVGPYYKGGLMPIDGWIQTEYDRAAPRGLGHVKAGGNYAAALYSDKLGKKMGFPISLYIDSKEHKYIDEFGSSNFIAITRDNKYVTPDSTSILPSITNKSLMTLANDLGIVVEKRRILIDELETFTEVGSVGTAAVITPISSITYGDKVYKFCEAGKVGETLQKLYNKLQGIQYGDVEDKYGWMYKIA